MCESKSLIKRQALLFYLRKSGQIELSYFPMRNFENFSKDGVASVGRSRGLCHQSTPLQLDDGVDLPFCELLHSTIDLVNASS